MSSFEWDEAKNRQNQLKHKVDFLVAQKAFLDPHRLVFKDIIHSTRKETRYYCIGRINQKVITVRFAYRSKKIRIFGAGYWRKERKIYETVNQTK